MYLNFPSSWGSRLKAEQGQPMGTYELHTLEAACLSLAMETCIAALPSPLIKHFLHFMHSSSVLEFVGMTRVLTHSPTFRACGHLLNMSDDCEEASQSQAMFCCD